MIRQGTMLYYSRSILGVREETPRTVVAIFGEDGHASVPGAVATLLTIALVALILTADQTVSGPSSSHATKW